MISESKYKDILYSAKRRNIECDVSLEYLNGLLDGQNGRCYYTNLFISAPNRRGGTASLDRIDSTLPYEPGNVVWVHTDINYMKHCLTEERFYELVELVHKKRKSED